MLVAGSYLEDVPGSEARIQLTTSIRLYVVTSYEVSAQ